MEKRKWLVMLFLGGDNDLFEFGDALLEEAQRVGSSDQVAVVVERDPADERSPSERGQLFPGRWEKRKIGIKPGDAETIISFIESSKKEFEAKQKILLLWDHGNGWQNTHVFNSVVDATDQLRVLDVAEVLGKQPDIDILCFDSCLMAMIEIAYQLRGKVKFIVASENVVPADSGWPYETLLRGLTTEPDRKLTQIVSAIVHGFSGAYNGSDEPITLSALDLTHVDDAVTAIDELACALIDGCMDGSCEKILFARRYCQSFGNPDYIDIVSFCEQLERLLSDTRIIEASKKVRAEVLKLVVASTRGATPSISGAHGASIYFPDRPISPLYYKLDFAKTSRCRWAAFLNIVTPVLEPPRPLEVAEEFVLQQPMREKDRFGDDRDSPMEWTPTSSGDNGSNHHPPVD
jgi:hypothetical protein